MENEIIGNKWEEENLNDNLNFNFSIIQSKFIFY